MLLLFLMKLITPGFAIRYLLLVTRSIIAVIGTIGITSIITIYTFMITAIIIITTTAITPQPVIIICRILSRCI